MSIIALLHNLLKEKLPSIHATRFTALMAAVEAGLKGASVSITELGRTLSGPACIKHKIKRMDRLAGNRHLNTERTAVYGAMTQWLLQSLPMPLILIDWSPLTADQHQQLLRAALPTGGRSVTLYEEIHPVKKLGNRRVQQRFLSSLQALLPANVTPIIVADSGFRTPFFAKLKVWAGIGSGEFAIGISLPGPTGLTIGWRQSHYMPKPLKNPSAWARPAGCVATR